MSDLKIVERLLREHLNQRVDELLDRVYECKPASQDETNYSKNSEARG